MKALSFLIVDDQPELLETYDEYIKEIFPDAKVFQAHDGRQGLEIIKREKLSLVITDHKMPVMTGAQMIQTALREVPVFRKCPCIVISGFTDDAKAETDSENIYFLDKPISFERFKNVLKLKLGISANS